MKFNDFGPIKALGMLGKENADLAMTFTVDQAEALHAIYKGKPLTDDEINLAKKFTNLANAKALKALG